MFEVINYFSGRVRHLSQLDAFIDRRTVGWSMPNAFYDAFHGAYEYGCDGVDDGAEQSDPQDPEHEWPIMAEEERVHRHLRRLMVDG